MEQRECAFGGCGGKYEVPFGKMGISWSPQAMGQQMFCGEARISGKWTDRE